MHKRPASPTRSKCRCGKTATNRCSAKLLILAEREGAGTERACGELVCQTCLTRVGRERRARCPRHALAGTKVVVEKLKPVCVRHQGGWCATDRKRMPKEETVIDVVPTTCAHRIVLPWGFERRDPDCPSCVAVLAKREARGRANR